MKSIQQGAKLARRRFLSGAGFTALGAAASAVSTSPSRASIPSARITYPVVRLANLSQLELNKPFQVAYPDQDAPGVLIRLGIPATGGAGPNCDVVGFSTICPHRGVPLHYYAESRTFNCPGHYSVFDCEAGGQETWGHATQNLPQYTLSVDPNGDIHAVGVDELLYGRLSNVL